MEIVQIISGCGSRWFGNYNLACRLACALIEHSPKLYRGQKGRDDKGSKSMSLRNCSPQPQRPRGSTAASVQRENQWQQQLGMGLNCWFTGNGGDCVTRQTSPWMPHKVLGTQRWKEMDTRWFWKILREKSKKSKTKPLYLVPLRNLLKNNSLRKDVVDVGDPTTPSLERSHVPCWSSALARGCS